MNTPSPRRLAVRYIERLRVAVRDWLCKSTVEEAAASWAAHEAFIADLARSGPSGCSSTNYNYSVAIPGDLDSARDQPAAINLDAALAKSAKQLDELNAVADVASALSEKALRQIQEPSPPPASPDESHPCADGR